MDLTAECLRDALLHIDLHGWDSDVGGQLLDHVRRAVVVPVVRRSGLRGPAGDQAEASGWQAAWDALRRPSARTAENPGGMVWVAVRRAVAAEVVPARAGGVGRPGVGSEPIHLALVAPQESGLTWSSLDQLMDSGWQPQSAEGGAAREEPGPLVSAILDGLVDVGWDRADAADAIAIMADHVQRGPAGTVTTRWRWVSLRVGVPEWRARRLAGLLLGGPGWPGVLERVVRQGPLVLADPDVRAALRSTTVRWQPGPGAWLAGSTEPLEGIACAG